MTDLFAQFVITDARSDESVEMDIARDIEPLKALTVSFLGPVLIVPSGRPHDGLNRLRSRMRGKFVRDNLRVRLKL